MVALLTVGAGLLTASLWHRIQEFAIGGVTIKLTDEAVSASAIPHAGVEAPFANAPYSTAGDEIAKAVHAIAERELKLVRVDLRKGDLWAAPNLALFALLLADCTRAELLVFIEKGEAGPDTYVGAAAVSSFADRLAARDPNLAAARRAISIIPLDAPPPNSIGTVFFNTLRVTTDSWIQKRPELVDANGLRVLADGTLVTASVVSEDARTLSTRQQRAILTFPLNYVPITEHVRLVQVVDRSRLAERIALSSVRV